MKAEQLLLVKFHKIYHRMSKTKDSQGRILKILTNHDGISQKELLEIMDVKAGSLSEILLKLEKAGLVYRSHDTSDMRVRNVHITDAGLAEFEQIQKDREHDSEVIFANLNSEEKEQLLALFNKIIGDAEQYKHAEKLARIGK